LPDAPLSETDDGRYLIVLRGLKRFSVGEEIETTTPYKKAKINFDKFKDDTDIHAAKRTSETLSDNGRADRSALTVAMKALAKKLNVQVDWDGLADIPLPILINQAAMISPFQPEDKQKLTRKCSVSLSVRNLVDL